MIFTWLNLVWSWLWNGMLYLIPTIRSPKRDHDSDYTSSEDDEAPGRVPYHSGNGVVDMVDNPKQTEPMVFDTIGQNVPQQKLKLETVRLKNPYCVVIINIIYENKAVPRNGAQADRENIERLLESAGFSSVHVYCDQKRIDILEIMETISQSAEMDDHDGLVVFISSHGKAKGILAVDKKIVEVEEITSRVNGKQCKALRGKPKLFFISACRGKTVDPGVKVDTGLVTSDSAAGRILIPKLPTEADFLVCYSTVKGYLSLRRFMLKMVTTPDMGTWLISTLTQVFEEKMKEEDVMQMLTRVNARVANMATRDDHENGMKQMPVQMHMLRHRVFFGK